VRPGFPPGLTTASTKSRKQWLIRNKPAIPLISSANGIERPILDTASCFTLLIEAFSIPPGVSQNGEHGAVGDAELPINMVQVNLHGSLGQP
jgi:hypothetical protein